MRDGKARVSPGPRPLVLRGQANESFTPVPLTLSPASHVKSVV